MAASFHSLAGVTGIVITKLDGTARGGGALSAVAATGAPIVHIGVGERIQDLEKFESDRFISRLLGMGDIQGLIDLAPEDMDEEEAMRLTQRLMSACYLPPPSPSPTRPGPSAGWRRFGGAGRRGRAPA